MRSSLGLYGATARVRNLVSDGKYENILSQRMKLRSHWLDHVLCTGNAGLSYCGLFPVAPRGERSRMDVNRRSGSVK